MNNIDKKLVKIIKNTFGKDYSEKELKEKIKQIDNEVPGILEVYDNILEEEKNSAFENLKIECDKLEDILNPINKEICVNCEKCCCDMCWNAHAHFVNLSDKRKKKFIELTKLYNWDENGFLGDKGCKLPREFRSYTCLSHICSKMGDKLHEIKKYTEFYKILDKIQRIQTKYIDFY